MGKRLWASVHLVVVFLHVYAIITNWLYSPSHFQWYWAVVVVVCSGVNL